MSLYEDKLFPVLLDWATRPVYRDRQRLLAQASGRVLELGVGTGANFPFYSHTATEIHGIEPAGGLLTLARDSAQQCDAPERFHIQEGDAQQLPYPDQHFDTVIACLVFCTIPDPDQAAQEAFRVLKPGGALLSLEHVLSERPWIQRLQKTLNPAWKPLACGCQLTRDTARIFQRAGFQADTARQHRHPKLPAFAGELYEGRLLRP
jgi:ubiquinone/menaquinone biosynthesis C-methylase UbiE